VPSGTSTFTHFSDDLEDPRPEWKVMVKINVKFTPRQSMKSHRGLEI
jgi:hypothetical protein